MNRCSTLNPTQSAAVIDADGVQVGKKCQACGVKLWLNEWYLCRFCRITADEQRRCAACGAALTPREVLICRDCSREAEEIRSEIAGVCEASRYLADASAEIAALGEIARLNPNFVRRMA